ncbi:MULTISPECIES: VWA domain-containing protein [unclassified Mycolicibacterium]|uniref:VWA domain-containing protein n=1 Tax=unclassified Mycolicibacterium TaxID=2636767 RepID=UPI002ED986C0
MTFDPIVAPIALFGLGALLIVIRMVALYRVLVRTGTGQYRKVVLRWGGLTLAVLMLVFAAARPGFDLNDDQPAEQPKSASAVDPNLNVFFVVDRSVNMRVQDFGDRQSRMTGVRADISSLINEYPRARFGLVSFASKAAVDWPLSDDAWSLQSLVHGLSPYTLVAPDAMYQANPTAARDELKKQLAAAARRFKDSKSLVFYFGSGDAGTRATSESFDLPDKAVSGGAVLGYGTSAGGPIPQGWVGATKVYQNDPGTGAPLNSTLDESTLKKIAGELGVPYFHREAGQSITAVLPAVDPVAGSDDENPLHASKLVERRELYWLFTMLAAVLVLGEIVLTIREFRRNRMSRKDVTS